MDSSLRSGDIAARCKQLKADGMALVSEFEQALGSTFTVETGGRTVLLELTDVSRIASSPRDGGGFSLLFKGPRDAALRQAMYRFTGGGIVDDIFIVPVSADAAGYVYQAVFN